MFGDDQIPQQRAPHARRLAVSSSLLSHILMVVLGLWISNLPRSYVSAEPTPVQRRHDLIWLAAPGPGGGGGGGGDNTPVPAPVRQAGKDRLTVPTARSEPAPVEKPKEPPPTPPLSIPAKSLADATDPLPGAILPAPSAAATQGPGSAGGAGTGTGTGSGEGRGSGVGPGFGGGIGGGAYRPGSGVSSPQVVREVKPNYTVDAMRAKVQGVVVVECVVLPDGTIGDVKILESLDKVFGLDQEAIKAAKQWRFTPGRRLGEPVPVYVMIELEFRLR